MPAQRGSVRHCEAVEAFGFRFRTLLSRIHEVVDDGLVTPAEGALLHDEMALAARAFDPLPGIASQQDGVMRWIGAVAHAGQVTPWIERITREAVDDEARLLDTAA